MTMITKIRNKVNSLMRELYDNYSKGFWLYIDNE